MQSSTAIHTKTILVHSKINVPNKCHVYDEEHMPHIYNNNNNNTLIYIAPACRMTSEALADSSSRATECLTEK